MTYTEDKPRGRFVKKQARHKVMQQVHAELLEHSLEERLLEMAEDYEKADYDFDYLCDDRYDPVEDFEPVEDDGSWYMDDEPYYLPTTI